MKQRGEAALIPFITAGDPDLGDYAQNHARLGSGRRRLHRVGHSVFRSDGGWTDDSALLGARFEECRSPCRRYFTWCASSAAAPNCRLFFSVISIRFFVSGWKSLPAKRRRAGADGVLCVDLPPEESGELKALDRPPGPRPHFSLVAHQRPGTPALGGAPWARLYLLRFGDRRHRRAPLFRRSICARQVARVRKATSLAGGRRFRHFDAEASGVDRRLCRRRRGRQCPGATYRARQKQS